MLYAAIYLAAIVLANLSVQYFGPASMPINAFLFIGLDLTLRDSLHDAWKEHLLVKMGALILAGAGITYLLNANAGWIGIASVIAFSAAAVGDTWMYDLLKERTYMIRANGSNVVGAALDSILFPTLAFGAFLPWAIAGQWVAKTFGGAVWAWVLDRFNLRVAIATTVLLLCLQPAKAQDVWLTAHYDVARQTPITSAVYQSPVGPVFVNGFAEVWYNHDQAFPAKEWTLFSKHWVSYPLTRRLSASVELEFLLNRPGVAFRWPADMTFQPRDRTLYVTPKIGLSYKVF